MSTPEDIWDDVHRNAIHDAHEAAGENHWFSCPLCDDEADGEDLIAQAEADFGPVILHGDV